MMKLKVSERRHLRVSCKEKKKNLNFHMLCFSLKFNTHIMYWFAHIRNVLMNFPLKAKRMRLYSHFTWATRSCQSSYMPLGSCRPYDEVHLGLVGTIVRVLNEIPWIIIWAHKDLHWSASTRSMDCCMNQHCVVGSSAEPSHVWWNLSRLLDLHFFNQRQQIHHIL